jgi:hypothetical protein
MTKNGKTQSNLASLDYSLGGFDWVDRDKKLWPLFARWLNERWYWLYQTAFDQRPPSLSWGDAFGAMEKAIAKLADELPKHSSRVQLALVNAEAKKLGLEISPRQVEDQFERFLKFQRRPEYELLLKASPWCNYFAVGEQICEQAGATLPYKIYPNEAKMRLSLECVISEFGSREIWRETSPEMSRLFAVRRALAKFDEAIKRLPSGSSLLPALQKAEPELQKFSASLEAEINQRANDPDAFVPPLRSRRLQRALFFAVRHLCKPKDGSNKLATFIQILLKAWPYVPAGMQLDLDAHFNVEKRHELVRRHLGLVNGQTNKDARALCRVLHAIVFQEELRHPLLILAHHARLQADKRRKGWQHLHKAFKAVFNHIHRKLSDEEQFRNFIRSNFPDFRQMPAERRNRLFKQFFPNGYRDQNQEARDLTKTEQLIIAEKCLRPKKAIQFDGDGRSSSAASYGRATNAILKELGIQKPKRPAKRRKELAKPRNVR